MPSALLVAFEKVNGSLDLAGPSRYVDHVPVRIKCGCCKQAWFFDFVWDLCHRIELGLDRWAAFAGSPARRYVLDVLQTQLPALLAGVTLPCVVPLVLGGRSALIDQRGVATVRRAGPGTAGEGMKRP